MRITRAYTITPEVKRILDTKYNKSQFVCRAVVKLHAMDKDFDVRDVTTRRLLVALTTRDDTPRMVKAIILTWLQEKL